MTKRYYRIVDSSENVEGNVPALLNIGATHYTTVHTGESIYRNFIIFLDEEELLIAKLSFNDISIFPVEPWLLEQLRQSGYIR